MTLVGAFTDLAILTTDRLRLRQMREDDAESVFAFKSDPEVTRHYGQEPHGSIDETKAWIQRSLIGYEQRDSVMWVITLMGDDTAIGACCFWNFDETFHRAEIGYELHPAYWHKGIMSEAVSAILTYGFVDMGLHRIEADPLAINERSQRLLLKLGFKYEGTLRQRHPFRDRFEDQLYFGLLNEEWMNRSTTL